MLMTPGPTPVPELIRKSMSNETIHHRTAEFKNIFSKTRELLLEILETPHCIILASSGTGAMEACITNLCSDTVLTINAGKFGERFGKICNSFDIKNIELKYDWNTPCKIEDVVNALKLNKNITSICIQICESAGGLRHPVEDIAKKVKEINKNIIVIADGITAVGVEKIDTTNIDALITGSQKAFMLPPGLSMIGLSDFAVDKINNKSTGYYFNLKNELKKQEQNTTAYTAATTLIIGLKTILEQMKEIHFDVLYYKTMKRADSTRKALKSIGLEIYPKSPSDAMTTVLHENSNKIRKILKDIFKVDVAGGQDHLNGQIFRINNMGFIEDYETVWVINAIEKTLDLLNIRSFDGLGNKTFMDNYFV